MTQERPEPFQEALLHVGSSLGLEMDVDTINALESAYWTPRGENFDFATGDSISALEMLQMIASAGKSRFLLSDGLATVSREGIKPWTGIITPHEMVESCRADLPCRPTMILMVST